MSGGFGGFGGFGGQNNNQQQQQQQNTGFGGFGSGTNTNTNTGNVQPLFASLLPGLKERSGDCPRISSQSTAYSHLCSLQALVLQATLVSEVRIQIVHHCLAGALLEALELLEVCRLFSVAVEGSAGLDETLVHFVGNNFLLHNRRACLTAYPALYLFCMLLQPWNRLTVIRVCPRSNTSSLARPRMAISMGIIY